MAKKKRRRKSSARKSPRRKRKITAHQRKFGATSRACIAKGPTTWKAFGRCMKSEL